jgi:hypothetical protein
VVLFSHLEIDLSGTGAKIIISSNHQYFEIPLVRFHFFSFNKCGRHLVTNDNAYTINAISRACKGQVAAVQTLRQPSSNYQPSPGSQAKRRCHLSGRGESSQPFTGRTIGWRKLTPSASQGDLKPPFHCRGHLKRLTWRFNHRKPQLIITWMLDLVHHSKRRKGLRSKNDQEHSTENVWTYEREVTEQRICKFRKWDADKIDYTD